MHYLSGPNIDEARAVLVAELPHLQVATVELAKQGWDNHTFILNDEWIVRFPKDHEFQSRQECWVTAAFADLSPIPIPRLELVGTQTAFAGHRMLPGVQLSEIWPACDPRQREAAIDRLTEFCAVLHRSLSVADAQAHGVGPEVKRLELVRDWLPEGGEWAIPAEEALARLDAQIPSCRVLHNDLHGENVLLDPERHEVTAVIDFGDVAFGDPCIDLNYLCEFDLHAAPQIARRYEAAGGEPVDPQRIRDLYFLQTLEDYLDPDVPEIERVRFREMIDEYLRTR